MDMKIFKDYLVNKSPNRTLSEASDAVAKALDHLGKAHSKLFAHDLGALHGEEALEQLEYALVALKGNPILNIKDRRYNKPLLAHINNTIRDFDDALSSRQPEKIKQDLMELRYQLKNIMDLIKNGH